MLGIDRHTGATLTGWALVVSDITELLTTQVGSRHKRRTIGSRCPELQGANNGPIAAARMRAYVAQALLDKTHNIASRFLLKRVAVQSKAGGFVVRLWGVYEGRDVVLDVD